MICFKPLIFFHLFAGLIRTTLWAAIMLFPTEDFLLPQHQWSLARTPPRPHTASLLVSAFENNHSLASSLHSTVCSRIDLKAWDHTIGWGQPVFSLVLHHARAIIQPSHVDFSISQSCSDALQPALSPPNRLTVLMDHYNLSTYADPVEPQTDSGPAQATPVQPEQLSPQNMCTKFSGVWLLLSDVGHAQDNVFEEGVISWYPTYLATHYAFKGLDPSAISITHVGGNHKGFLAFQDVYQLFGRYVPWQMVVGGGGSSSSTSCVEFETAITITSYWSWLSVPVMAGHNRGLTSFASALTHHFNHTSNHPGTCRRKFVYAARSRIHRCIENKEEVMAAIRTNLSGYEIVVVDMAVLSLSKQIQLVRTADIFMFEHGGAGPLVMMQSPGSVTIEIFPWGFADPMYRNMAIMTGKTYLSWQNPDKSKAVGDTNRRNTNSVVDVPALMAIVTSAKHVVNNNVANKFVRTGGEPYERQLCEWCEEHEKFYACHDGDI